MSPITSLAVRVTRSSRYYSDSPLSPSAFLSFIQLQEQNLLHLSRNFDEEIAMVNFVVALLEVQRIVTLFPC